MKQRVASVTHLKHYYMILAANVIYCYALIQIFFLLIKSFKKVTNKKYMLIQPVKQILDNK